MKSVKLHKEGDYVVSIVTRLSAGWSRVRFPAETKKRSPKCQTNYDVHQDSYAVGIGVIFPNVNRPGREADHSV